LSNQLPGLSARDANIVLCLARGKNTKHFLGNHSFEIYESKNTYLKLGKNAKILFLFGSSCVVEL